MVTPRTETERAVFEVWKELRPDEAFVFGLDECAGRLFIPTQRRAWTHLGNRSHIQKAPQNPHEKQALALVPAGHRLLATLRLPPALLESLFRDIIQES